MNTYAFMTNIANATFKGAANVLPTTFYLGLATNDSITPSTTAAEILEPSGGSYARQNISTKLGVVSATGSVTNTEDIEFPEATGSGWGDIEYYVIFDAETGGNLLMYGEFAQQRTVTAGETIICKTGALTLSIQNATAS